ncbi:hypothetical protein, partial [Pseudomonas sp. 2822-17]|uniref:hypothetical protein n=1 Tax=Pseudomonas sp. 2822-17 TaxID=1712678 RepID=UPI00211428E7
EISKEHEETFRQSPVPIVLSATVDEKKEFPSVNINYEQASFDATKALIDKGHKSVAMLSGTLEDPINGYQKFAGYKRALLEADLEISDDFIVIGDYTY